MITNTAKQNLANTDTDTSAFQMTLGVQFIQQTNVTLFYSNMTNRVRS